MNRRRRTPIGGAMALLVSAWLVGAPGSWATAQAAPDGTLVIASSGLWEINPAGDYDIFTMNPDGTGVVNLTETVDDSHDLGPYDTAPRWSPDGTRIAWTLDPDGQGGDDGEIWVMDRDGANKAALTDNQYDEWGPTWSPDGSRIAWTVYDPDFYDFDIWLMNADGSDAHNVVAESPEELQWNEWAPDWTQDGRIVFSGTEYIEDIEVEGAFYKIRVMDADGTNLQTLSQRTDPADGIPSHDEMPAVSPTGEWIAFGLNPQPEQGWDIAVIRTSDGAQFNLTDSYMSDEMFPMWSPDGTKLVFTMGDGDLYYIDVASFPTEAPAATRSSAAPAAAPPEVHRLTNVGGIQSADWHGESRPSPFECTQTGSSGPDTLRGTPGRDVICGLGGSDTIYGFGGKDLLIGGPGADQIYGGYGADALRGGFGADDLFGNGGLDRLIGGAGNDDLRGGASADTCVQGPGAGLVLGCEG